MKHATWGSLDSAERIALHMMDIDGSESAINSRSAKSLQSKGLVTINELEKCALRGRCYASLTLAGIELAKGHR